MVDQGEEKVSVTGKLREGISSRPILWAGLIGAAAFILGGIAGYASIASKANSVNDLKESNASLEAQLADTEAELEDTKQSVGEQLDAIKAKEESIYDKARKRRDDLKAEVDDLESEVADKQARLRDLQEQIGSTKETIAKSSISDGIWESGTDFIPGTYQAPGGSGCYWALLGSADTSDIINNGGFSKNQLIAIDSPYFETDGCGTWKLVE